MSTVSSATTSAARLGILSPNSRDKKIMTELGKKLGEAQKKFETTATNPNATPWELQAAKMDVEKTAQAFESFMAIRQVMNKIFQRIIDAIRSIGS
jgi:hypothetical protein